MKVFVILLFIGLALNVDSFRLRRQVNEDYDNFWNPSNFPPSNQNQGATTTTRRPAQAAQPTAQQQTCITGCPSTNEYNPVCGSNGQQYQNIGKLNCARGCGINVTPVTRASCNPLT